MPLNWIDTGALSFNSLLLLEYVQLTWMPGWLPESELALALQANPAVAWYFRHKCPELVPWLEEIAPLAKPGATAGEIRSAEQAVLACVDDLLVYALDPAVYDRLPFLDWDSQELTSLVDFRDKVVLDIGSGTGRLALEALPAARVVYAVEPVENLRRYLKTKFLRQGFTNFFAVDGLITEIPFPNGFADVVLGGHVFGDKPAAEREEMERVTRPGGCIVLCPGNRDVDNEAHCELAAHGYRWARFYEPGDGWRRKYWRTKV